MPGRTLSLFGKEMPENEPAPLAVLIQLVIGVARFAKRPLDLGSPLGRALYHRLSNPKEGDVIVEMTTFEFDPDSLGLFVARLLDDNRPDGRQQDPFYYLWRVQSLATGKRHNWSNAEFRVVVTKELFAEVQGALQELKTDH